MTSNYTGLAQNLNATSFQEILNYANLTTNDTFWTGIYWMIMAVIFFSASAFGWEISIMLTFFGGMIMGIFLLYLDLIDLALFGMTEAILLFIVIYFIYSSRSNN